MKNNKVLFGIIGAIALAIVDLVVFTVIKNFTATRWINIVFLNFAVIVAWGSTFMLGNKENEYLNYSRLPIIAGYSGLAFALSVILLALNLKNVLFTIVPQLVLLGVFGVVFTTNTMTNNLVENSKNESKQNYSKIKDLANRLEVISKSVDDRNIAKKIEKAYDEVNSAKIKVEEDTTQVDNDILQSITMIEFYVQNKDFEKIDEQVNKIRSLVAKRNQMQ